jgi:hypothetical protein
VHEPEEPAKPRGPLLPRRLGRIRKGTYGLVLVLQPFVAHKASEPIVESAKAARTPWALVDGYGVQAVKLWLERFLGGPRSGSSPPEEHDVEEVSPSK